MFDNQEGDVIKSAFFNIKIVDSPKAISSAESSRGFNVRKNLEGIGRLGEANIAEAYEERSSREKSTELQFNL
jgi:hypothetical protein